MSRRELVKGLAAAGVISSAGCTTSSDTNSDNNSEEQSNNQSGNDNYETTTEKFCDVVGGELTPYEAGRTNQVCDFDVPKEHMNTQEEFEFQERMGPIFTDRSPAHRGTLSDGLSGPGEYVLTVSTTLEQDRVGVNELAYNLDRDANFQMEYQGEEFGVWRPLDSDVVPDDDSSILANATTNIPYEYQGDTLYLSQSISIQLDMPFDEEIPEDCKEEIDSLVQPIAESFRPNEETTIEQHIEQEWEDPIGS